MSIKAQIAGVLRTVQRISIKRADILTPVRRARIMQGDVLKTVYMDAVSSSLSVSVSPLLDYAFSFSQAVQSNTITATPDNGVAPYSYAWTVITHSSPEAPIIASPSSAATILTQHGVGFNSIETATVRCTVTDVTGASVFEESELTFENIFSGFNFGSGLFS